MGFFGKAIDSRTHQILRNNLGHDVEFDFIGGGTLSIDNLQYSINPFIAAVNDQGIYFIHRAEVVLALPWSKILRCRESIWGKGNEIMIEIERISNTVTPNQFPRCYWHKAEIRFNDHADQARFIDKFKLAKLRSGFNENSLEKFGKWVEFGVGMPSSIEEYHKANANWGTEELRNESYKAWGNFLDAQAFLFFTGRSICEGKLPGKVLDLAFEEWKTADTANASFTRQNLLPSGENLDLITSTSKLPWQGSGDLHNRNIPEEWVLGSIETSPDEWQSPMKLVERRIAIQGVGKGQGHPSIRIWNDFHRGESTIIGIGETQKLVESNTLMVGFLKLTLSDQALEKVETVWR